MGAPASCGAALGTAAAAGRWPAARRRSGRALARRGAAGGGRRARRGAAGGRRQLSPPPRTPRPQQVLGAHNIICVEDLIHEIYTVGPAFKQARASRTYQSALAGLSWPGRWLLGGPRRGPRLPAGRWLPHQNLLHVVDRSRQGGCSLGGPRRGPRLQAGARGRAAEPCASRAARARPGPPPRAGLPAAPPSTAAASPAVRASPCAPSPPLPSPPRPSPRRPTASCGPPSCPALHRPHLLNPPLPPLLPPALPSPRRAGQQLPVALQAVQPQGRHRQEAPALHRGRPGALPCRSLARRAVPRLDAAAAAAGTVCMLCCACCAVHAVLCMLCFACSRGSAFGRAGQARRRAWQAASLARCCEEARPPTAMLHCP